MEILNEARAVYSEIQAVRHQLHRFPELGHREVETTRLIRACLEEYGAEVLDYGFPTGLAARIRGGHPGKLLALREDIDALPILENTGLPFASQTPGVCHACGHDVHTAALLGCAKLLARRREELWGDVLLIFQCGEETFDGAAAMLSQGLFRDGTPHAVVGFHCAPDLPLGTISIREGIANASCDSIRLEVTGKGGHGAHPELCVDPVVELCVDPVVLSAGLLMQLQTLVSRNNNPADPVVLTFGEIHGGTAPNIIPNTVTLRGTLRTLDNDVRRRHLEAIAQIGEDFCRTFGGSCTAAVELGVPPLVNDPESCRLLHRAADRVLGPDCVETGRAPSMGSDDFSCLLEECGNRGVQFQLGTAQEGLPQSGLGLHVAENIFPDEALLPGIALLTQFALDDLSPNR